MEATTTTDFEKSFDKFITQPVIKSEVGNILVNNKHKIGYKSENGDIYLAEDITIRLGEDISISVTIKEWIDVIYEDFATACSAFGGNIIFVPKKELPK